VEDSFKYSVNECVVSNVILTDLSNKYKRCVIGRTADKGSYEIRNCVITATSQEILRWLAMFWFEEKKQ